MTSFDEFYASTGHQGLAVAYAMTGNWADAEDLVRALHPGVAPVEIDGVRGWRFGGRFGLVLWQRSETLFALMSHQMTSAELSELAATVRQVDRLALVAPAAAPTDTMGPPDTEVTTQTDEAAADTIPPRADPAELVVVDLELDRKEASPLELELSGVLPDGVQFRVGFALVADRIRVGAPSEGHDGLGFSFHVGAEHSNATASITRSVLPFGLRCGVQEASQHAFGREA